MHCVNELVYSAQESGAARHGIGTKPMDKEASGPIIEPNQLLKIFFETADKTAVAEQHASSLSEKFFIVLDSFMGLVSNPIPFTST